MIQNYHVAVKNKTHHKSTGFKPCAFVMGAMFIIFLTACQSDTNSSLPLFTSLSPQQTGVNFTNRLRESPQQNVLTYEYFYNGAGVAVADFNDDEYPDLYFVSNVEPNQLYLNQGDFTFQEIAAKSGVQGKRGFTTGVTTVDINSDGQMDIYLCKSGRFDNPDLRRNELYIHQGIDENGIPTFKEEAAKYGLNISAYSTQATFFDYDRDGDLDIFLINHDIDTYADDEIATRRDASDDLVGEMLFRNDNGQFTEVTQAAGIINNRLGYGLGVGVGDLNNDGWADVYVSNDYSGKDHLYINQKDGTFQEKIRELTAHTSFYSMGNDVGDINNDGWQDIVNLDMIAQDNYGIKTSMSAMNPDQFATLVEAGQHHQYMFNTLLLNNGRVGESDPYFSDIGQMSGISNTDWSWSPLLFDMDNDGWQDLMVTNGIKRNIRNNDAMKTVRELNARMQADPANRARYMQEMLRQFPYHRKTNYFYRNSGDLSFENITKQLGMDSLVTASNGAAYADIDLDGDLDLVVNNVDAPATILKNNSLSTNYLQVKLKGSDTNPTGVGARVYVRCAEAWQSREMYTTRGYLSAVEPILHFGLAGCMEVYELRVYWHDGRAQVLRDIEVNQRLILNYEDAEVHPPAPPESSTGQASKGGDFSLREKNTAYVFPPLEGAQGVEHAHTIFNFPTKKTFTHKHRENDFDDFKRESLLPHKMSQMGPAMAVGDVNGDGREDVFVGGAKGFESALYLQNQDGQMLPSNEKLWASEKGFEDVAAVFLDLDGDMDLLVGSGSNEWEAGHEAYFLRFYENEGKGIFRKNETILPRISVSTGVLSAMDFDADGDVDVFVGGRQVPGAYPSPADSYLLRNDNGKFTDITNEIAPFLREYGMVTDAIWTDLNDDNRPDLITVGEWMSPRILMNYSDGFKDETPEEMQEQTGWWYSIAAADFDGDGDTDLVGGNLGLNYKYKASSDAPFEIYTNDFDESGSLDIVLGYHANDEVFPLRGRECSSAQMPFIKTQFPTYDAFGKATLSEVYSTPKLEQSTHYTARNFASSYFENKGNGSFQIKNLPQLAQVSSINDILVKDFDKDGHLDLLVAGNLYDSEVETPRNDASIGLLLRGDGKGNFETVPSSESGVQIIGEVRHLLPFQNGVLVGRNDDDVLYLSY